MITLGLTGSIGMGKTTTAQMFRTRGVPVWDADEAVHRLYSVNGDGAAAIAKLFPEAVGPMGVERSVLKKIIGEDQNALGAIENVIHPLVARDREAFLKLYADEDLVLFDIPLLFETGADTWLDKTIVVSASEDIQQSRVMERPGMTEEHFKVLLSKQVPDAEKRRRADFVIDTTDMDTAERGVDHVLSQIRRAGNA
ncbi:MAG: dephospho-CoA kinase [Dinoroseobacter sp.]|nr:dephospho-CoA kinase [Dinoroseobacter sp.]